MSDCWTRYTDVELPFTKWLQATDWSYLKGDAVPPDVTEREAFGCVLLTDDLRRVMRPHGGEAAVHSRSGGCVWEGFTGGDVPGAEEEGDEEIRGVSYAEVGAGGVGEVRVGGGEIRLACDADYR